MTKNRERSRSSALKTHRVSDVIIPMYIAVTLDRRQHVVGQLSASRKRKQLYRLPTISALSATTSWLNSTSDRSTTHFFSPTIHRSFSRHPKRSPYRHPATTGRLSFPGVTDNFPYPNFILSTRIASQS